MAGEVTAGMELFPLPLTLHSLSHYTTLAEEEKDSTFSHHGPDHFPDRVGLRSRAAEEVRLDGIGGS